MYGAIIGDIVGSRFEWKNHKSKDFDFLTNNCIYTDDSVMTIAIMDALIKCNGNYDSLNKKAIECMVNFGRKYSDVGYGPMFYTWIHSLNHNPYNSFGNGAAMRVSGCGFIAKSLDEAKRLSKMVTEVSHDHGDAIKAAEAVACAIFMARNKYNMDSIKKYITDNYYEINFRLDDIRDIYSFDATCMGSIPEAFEAFFESNNFEDAIRNAISIGGDSDTIAAICGSIAGAYYGVPNRIIHEINEYLPNEFIEILDKFNAIIN